MAIWHVLMFTLFLSLFPSGMAPDNQLPLLWFSWIQFCVQHHLSVSFITASPQAKTEQIFQFILKNTTIHSNSSMNIITEALTKRRYRYCRMLEEGCFRGRTADFVFMFLFGGIVMTVSFYTLKFYSDDASTNAAMTSSSNSLKAQFTEMTKRHFLI